MQAAERLSEPESFAALYLEESARILRELDPAQLDAMARALAAVRDRAGRLFLLGVGGSAANASHAVNDFRKIAGFEAYSPTDNVSELTARINDDGWDTAYANWLCGSRLGPLDAIFVLSVGGGDVKRNISINLVQAVRYTRTVGAAVFGIVGHSAGFTAQTADLCIVVPPVSPKRVTPHTEGMQAVLWHLLIS